MYAAAEGGVAQNILCPPFAGYAMQTQKGATGPGDSLFILPHDIRHAKKWGIGTHDMSGPWKTL